MNYLITGTGRCGTGYMSKVFTVVGLNCTHEGLFQPRNEDITRQQVRLRINNPDWEWRGESSWLATPFLHWEELRDWTIIHVIRDPKKVIDSKLRLLLYKDPDHRKYFNWAMKYFPEIEVQDGIVDQAAMWYVTFIKAIRRHEDVLHKIEVPVEVLLDKLKIEYDQDDVDCVPKDYNSRIGLGPSDFHLEDVKSNKVRNQLRQIGLYYGYQW